MPQQKRGKPRYFTCRKCGVYPSCDFHCNECKTKIAEAKKAKCEKISTRKPQIVECKKISTREPKNDAGQCLQCGIRGISRDMWYCYDCVVNEIFPPKSKMDKFNRPNQCQDCGVTGIAENSWFCSDCILAECFRLD